MVQGQVGGGHRDGAECDQLRPRGHAERDLADEEQADRQHDGGRDLHDKARLRRLEWEEVDRRHVENPRRVGVSLDRLSAWIPHQAVPVGEVSRVSHRDHRVVEQREVPLAGDDKARAIDEQRGIHEEQTDHPPERQVKTLAPARNGRVHPDAFVPHPSVPPRLTVPERVRAAPACAPQSRSARPPSSATLPAPRAAACRCA